MSDNYNDDFDDDFGLLEDDEFDESPRRSKNLGNDGALSGNNKSILVPVAAVGVMITAGLIGYNILNQESVTKTTASTSTTTKPFDIAKNNNMNDSPSSLKDKMVETREDNQKNSVETVTIPLPDNENKSDMVAEAKPIPSDKVTTKNKAEQKIANKSEDKNESFEELNDLFAGDEDLSDEMQDDLAERPIDKTNKIVKKDNKAHDKIAQNSERVEKLSSEVNKSFEDISDEISLNMSQIKSLENTIANLNSSMNQLNQIIAAMDDRVLSLTNAVDNLNDDVANIKTIITQEDLDLTARNSVPKPANAVSKKPMMYSSLDYSVHAIIPGRAWLKNNSGKIITVTEGDILGDYGRIAAIDSTNSVVHTSSGVMFK